LDYALYFEKGERKMAQFEDYTSANTHALSDEELSALLLKLDYIQQELKG
jgi:UDP-glucose 4-epimerase